MVEWLNEDSVMVPAGQQHLDKFAVLSYGMQYMK